MRKRSSLFSRLAAATAVLAVLVTTLAAVFSILLNLDLVRHTIQISLRDFSRSFAERALLEDDPEIWSRIARRHQIAIWVHRDGQQLAFDDAGEAVDPSQVLDAPYRAFNVSVELPDGEAVFVWGLGRFAHSHVPLVAGHIVLLLLAIGGIYWFQWRQLRPLHQLRRGVEAVAAGALGTRVPVVRQDEIGQVARAFNRMTAEVERMVADRERLLGDVSHELRSPLARMKVALELLPEGDKRDSLHRDVTEMERLTSVLLDRSRLPSHAAAAPATELGGGLEQVVATFRDETPPVRLTVGDGPLVAAIEPALWQSLGHNLVDNAVKFSRADSAPVEVSLHRRPGQDGHSQVIELVVRDDGPGVPEGELQRVLEPFVKLDPARGHHRGFGLGLDLCRRIAERHGGTLALVPGEPRGLRAVVTLPAADGSSSPRSDSAD